MRRIVTAFVNGSFGTALLLAAAPATAQEDTILPPRQMAGSIAVLSGGIGLDEVAAMRAEARRWPLTLEFAQMAQGRASWIADVHVRIVRSSGEPLAEIDSLGPLMLVDLPSGAYRIEATHEGQTQKRSVSIAAGAKGSKTSFVWSDRP